MSAYTKTDLRTSTMVITANWGTQIKLNKLFDLLREVIIPIWYPDEGILKFEHNNMVLGLSHKDIFTNRKITSKSFFNQSTIVLRRMINEEKDEKDEKDEKYDKDDQNKDIDDEYSFKWCPIIPSKIIQKKTKKSNHKHSLKDEKNVDELLRAANKFENVKLNKWYSGKMGLSTIQSKKYLKGYCQPPKEKTKKQKLEQLKKIDKDKDGNDEGEGRGKVEGEGRGKVEGEGRGDGEELGDITLENYIPSNCSGTITPSKGGYKRPQLFKFGKNILKIPYTQLIKPYGELLQKPELCRIINAKFRAFKKRGKEITDEDRLKAYEKNIDDCENGESKGGYSFNDLKELAINYYGVEEEKLKDMSKPQICTHIKNVLHSIKENEDILPEEVKKELQMEKQEYKLGELGKKNAMIYPGDINDCKETPNRGGFTVKNIKKIAAEQFNINTEHKHKDELCDEMANMLKENKKIIIRKSREKRDTKLSASKIKQFRQSFSDLFDNPSLVAIPDNDNSNSTSTSTNTNSNNDDMDSNIDSDVDFTKQDKSTKPKYSKTEKSFENSNNNEA